MPSFSRKLVLFAWFVFLGMSVSTKLWAAGSATVVISQIYTAGGNGGAIYNADYVELHNVSGTNQSLKGFALQYSAATGSANPSSAIPLTGGSGQPADITLAPGQFYLVGGTASATNGAALPATVDQTLSGLAMGASAGRISLTSNSTSLPASNLCTGSSIVDFVGYGTTAVCYEGSGPAATATTTLASIRAGNGCTDTDDNKADFATGTPAPRNSSSTVVTCSAVVPSSLGVTAAVAPTSVYGGSATLLTASVTPGAAPASTGVTVTADLSALGGSSTQALYDDGTHGDKTSGDGIYSYSLTVPGSHAANPYSITVKASDAQLRSATSSATLTVLAPVGYVAIHTIQANPSSYNGQVVTVAGIVTGVRSNGFYVQLRDNAADNDPTTSEAIYIHTGTGNVPSTATIGTEMQVSGTVQLYPTTATVSSLSNMLTRAGTEIDSPNGYTVLSTAQGLPSAVTLTTTNPSPTGGVNQLLRYQSMRVAIPNFTTTSGTDGTFDEPNQIYTSNGQFWGVVTGTSRPIREPGLEVLDSLTASQASTIARFDDNPELIQVDSNNMVGSPAPINVTSSTQLTNMSGIMDFSAGAPLFIMDAANRPTVGTGMTAIAVPAPAGNEITIGDLNMERFYNDVKDTAGATVLTTDAYQRRLKKVSLAIRNIFGTPDIMAVEETENLTVLQAVASQISSDAITAGKPDPQYAAYLQLGTDSTGISVGFLVKPSKVTVVKVEQFGKTDTYTNSTGAQATLNDRPPLVLHAGIKRTGGADYPLTLIVNHLRSLNNVTDSDASGANVRLKRERQAEYLAKLIQGYQSAGEHVIATGDFNSFEFNDGLADSINIIRGVVTPASQDVVPGPTTALVTPALVDPAPTNLAKGDYSYVYVGNAQTLDHFLVTSDIAANVHTTSVHLNADFPVVFRNDGTRPERTSDHDGIVGYLAVPGLPALTVTPTSLDFGSQVVKTTTTTPLQVTVKNSGTTAITFTSIVASPSVFAQTNNCGASLAGGASCTVNLTFTPATTGAATGTLTLTDSDIGGMQTVSLTGTGTAATGTPTVTASAGSVVTGNSVTLTATLTGNSATLPSGTVTFYDGSTALGTQTLAAGTASLNTSTLTVGPHNITATYNGDATYPTATSSAITVTVLPTSSTTTLAASTTNAVSGTSITFTATVTGNSAASTPSGMVTFLDGAATLGTGTLASGKATFTTGALAVGPHNVTASYAGNATYPTSVSGVMTVTITAPPVPDFSFTVANSQVIVSSNAPISFTAVTVAMVNGFSQTVSFACTGLPGNSRCTFSPPTLTSSGSSTVTISANTSAQLHDVPAFGEHSRGTMALALLGLPFLLLFRRRARRIGAVLGVLLVGLAVASISGCGNNPSTAKGTSTVTITATGGSVSHSATFTLIVQ